MRFTAVTAVFRLLRCHLASCGLRNEGNQLPYWTSLSDLQTPASFEGESSRFSFWNEILHTFHSSEDAGRRPLHHETIFHNTKRCGKGHVLAASPPRVSVSILDRPASMQAQSQLSCAYATCAVLQQKIGENWCNVTCQRDWQLAVGAEVFGNNRIWRTHSYGTVLHLWPAL